MWIILIIVIFILSLYCTIIIKGKNYKINLFEIIKNDKGGLLYSIGLKLGVGSVIGTLSSIIIGGISSIFWIIIFSFISSSLIYLECFLGKKYKQVSNNGNISGPYYIVRYGLNNKFISIITLILFLILYSFLFQMIQINTISIFLKNTLNISDLCIIFFIIAIILLIITSSSNINNYIIKKLTIIKCILFFCICFYGIVVHFNELIMSINNMELFNYKSIFSGLIIGVKRSIFMNEILIGTTSSCSCKDNNYNDLSCKYQIVSMYIVTLLSTLLISSLFLIYTNNNEMIFDYNKLLTNIFIYTSGKLGLFLLFITLVLFSITTLLGGFDILISNVSFITNNKVIINFVKLLFLIICLLGVVIDKNNLWKYSDFLIFIMLIINSYCIIKLSRK